MNHTIDSFIRFFQFNRFLRLLCQQLEVCGTKSLFVLKGLTMVIDYIEQNSHDSIVVFCNSRNQSLHITGQLERKLDMKKLSVNVLNINGSLDKNDKFWRIRLFCDNYHSCRGNLRALVTTNASNVGIDKHSISLQVRFEWPRDLLTYFQEPCHFRSSSSHQSNTTGGFWQFETKPTSRLDCKRVPQILKTCPR